MSSSHTGTARTAQGSGSLGHLIPRLAAEIAHLAHLDPGSAAALRRGPLSGAGAAAFWKLLARYGPDGDERKWATLVQAIAILTPRGRKSKQESAYEREVSMGKALFKANVSELRLARLLAAPPDQRSELVIRACRRLARTEFKRFDVVRLGQFVLSRDNTLAAHRIARDYYRADLSAKRKSKSKETPTDA